MIAFACAVAPVALMPDAALGLSGRLTSVDYPSSYASLARRLPSLPAGDVALVPFQSYRAPAWNNDSHPVLAPLGRFLPRRVVVEDRLVVDGRPIEGEDPRAEEVRDALAEASPVGRAAGLRKAGIRLLVVEQLPGVSVPDVAGSVVWRGDSLAVVDVGSGDPVPGPPAGWRVAMALAWGLWCSLALVTVGRALRHVRRTSPR
jgi:hypothetical protein